jgi:hypothetical protein
MLQIEKKQQLMMRSRFNSLKWCSATTRVQDDQVPPVLAPTARSDGSCNQSPAVDQHTP